MNLFKEQLKTYYKNQGYTEEQIDSLLKGLEQELQKMAITVITPNGVWSPLELSTKEQLGIPDTDYDYHIIPGNKSRREEVALTQEFLVNLPNQVPEIISFQDDIDFINYGDTELVYVTSSPQAKKTILVGQPIVPLGQVKIEYDNLRHLASKNPHLVVSPLSYVTNGTREAYITPYIYQARCIASSGNNYGAYIPEPYYRFEPYSKEDEYLITKVIIANLIRLYDADNKLALADCKIGGGDFIMEREFDDLPHTEENALTHMKLIAARKLINIEIKDYISLLQKEFQKRTYYRTIQEKDPSILVNLKNRIPMQEQAINDGIKLGLTLRKY